MKAAHSTLLFIVVIAVRWSHIVTVTVTVVCHSGVTVRLSVMESQTGVQKFNKIIHFVPFEPGTTDRSKPAEFISTVRGSKI